MRAVTKLLGLLAPVLALAGAAPAPAAPVVGLSETNPVMFRDNSFLAMGVSTTRLLTPYDVIEAAGRGGPELERRVIPYLEQTEALGIEPLVAFERSAGDPEACATDPRPCRLPSPDEYRAAVRAFLVRFPSVTAVTPWNEANHYGQPTAKAPERAAQYANVVDQVCRELRRRCTIVVADLLDQADRPSAARPTFAGLGRWIRRFRSALRIERGVCGLHNYSDVNRARSSGTRALMRGLGCREYWLTETGGIFRFGGFWTPATRRPFGCAGPAACQLVATERMLAEARRDRRIKRIYVHTWYSGSGQRFDSGLVVGTNAEWDRPPRPAYYAVREAAWDGPAVRLPPRGAPAPTPPELPLPRRR